MGGMYDAIRNFNKQFEYKPEIINPEKLKRADRFIIAGMGGSNLVADLLLIRDPHVKVLAHRDYGLPAMSEAEFKKCLLIASSYSGNTEETVDALEAALKKNLSAAVIATGGKLIDIAKERKLSYVQMPDTGIQPRSALGFNMRAILKLMGREDLLEEAGKLASLLNSQEFEEVGRELAEKLKGRVPIIYSSNRNLGLAYNWKIKFNETGKIPAFYNIVSELNHNEMTGFDIKDQSRKLSDKFHFIFLKDMEDNPKILKRFEVLGKLYSDRGLPVEVVELSGKSVFHKIFSSLVLADWVAYFTAEQYGLESEEVPMVEEFKKLID